MRDDADSPNEAVAPPLPSEVPAYRLSDFRCGWGWWGGVGGGGPYEYPVSNSLAPANRSSVPIDATKPFESPCGCLNEVVKQKIGLLLTDVELGGIFSGLSASSRTEYKSEWL